ncbi:putative disease resistance RPP13-like protein 1 [Gossypium raimondii]|uniref:putative disease resistance RPP13-like protein 1 n=1 Tax=Gossypium raimondii TaxID=29730 RepID=UPI00227B3ADC|nr:putative disease resistance RPP13-like protein 1 [Gossypium raimondii]
MSVIGKAAVFLELLERQWESILPDIQAVLDDVEEKQINNNGVKKWLEDLQDLAYDIDDILDKFAYEELRLKHRKTQAQASTSKVKEITARLNSLTTRMSSLGLSEILSQALTSKGKQPRLQPTSVLDGVMEYVGRHKEKTEMIALLKGDNSNGVWKRGTNIIVTTRLQTVSSIMDPLKAFHLDQLSNEDCLSIFTQHALKVRNFDGHLRFKEIGEKIVRRCKGLPLAAKAIGSLLRIVKLHREWINN